MSDYFYTGLLTSDRALLKVMDDSILNPYDGTLDKYRVTYTFTNEEFRKYRFNPWKVSLDAYGTTEYWFLPLHANELYSANEFDLKTLSMYNQDVIPVVDEILAISKKFIIQEKHKAEKVIKDIEFQLESETNKIYNTKIIDIYSY